VKRAQLAEINQDLNGFDVNIDQLICTVQQALGVYVDGNAVANLTYRITALYSGCDSVLGASAGLKHFGMRRLGRSGLSTRPPLADPSSPTDNVWDVDCSSFFPPEVDGAAIHGAYFVNEGTLNLMRRVLRGLDRGVLDRLGYTKGATWP
jgi:hypothetical protein